MGRMDIVCLKPNRADLNIGKQRGLNVLPKLCCDCGSFPLIGHDKWLTHSSLRHTFNEITVNGCANAKGEHVGLIKILAYVIEDAGLTRNVTIGYQDDAARNMPLSWKGHSLFD